MAGVIVHGPVGSVHERERFLACNASMGPTIEAETSEVACRERGGRATIVTCFQKLRIRRLPDLPPFLVQAVARGCGSRPTRDGALATCSSRGANRRYDVRPV
jgi:hypothetical protein